MSSYPLDVEVRCTDRVARWRPLFNWVLLIPSFLWAGLLSLGAGVVAVVGWLAIVFTGRLPEGLGNYLVGVLRYTWRIDTYLYGLTDTHPGFRVVAGYVDPGDSPAVLYSARPSVRRRVAVAFRAVLVIPQLAVLYLVNLAALVVLVIGWFAVLATGRWPRGLQSFVVGWMRWTFRVSAYLYLVVDDYPPFGFPVEEGRAPGEPTWPEPSRALPEPSTPPVGAVPGSSEVVLGVGAAQPESSGPGSSSVTVAAAPPTPEDLGLSLDPGAAAGPPWPRLVASGTAYAPPRLIRWPVGAGVVVFAGWVTATAVVGGSASGPPSSAAPYRLTAVDAGFTSTFPGRPQRSEKAVGNVRVITYISSLADHAVAVASFPVPASATYDLDRAVTGVAAGEQGGKVVSRTSVTYQGQPAEDGVISFSGGVEQVRVVVLGSSAYLFEGVGTTPSAFANDYGILLASFTPS
jgi:hypothetical protein